MSREAWNSTKRSKQFYVSTYRKVGTWVLVMLLCQALLIMAIIYSHFSQPPTAFYATDGVTQPIQLTPLNRPNDGNEALLTPDPINEDEIKVIPQ